MLCRKSDHAICKQHPGYITISQCDLFEVFKAYQSPHLIELLTCAIQWQL
jgi:hypothetical protein